MITLNSTIQDFLNDARFAGLKPHTKIAFLYLLKKADKNRTIHNFSIRKQAKEWKDNDSLKLTGNKDMVSLVIKELEEANLVKSNFALKKLIIL